MKAVLGVVLGYIAMLALVVGLLFGLYAVLGTEGSFQPGSYESSGVWNIASLVFGFLAALGGGWVCARVAKIEKASLWLAAVVVVLGIVMSLPAFGAHGQDARPGGVSGMEAMQKAYTPAWVAILNIVLGAGGVLLMRKKG